MELREADGGREQAAMSGRLALEREFAVTETLHGGEGLTHVASQRVLSFRVNENARNAVSDHVSRARACVLGPPSRVGILLAGAH